MWTPNIYYAAAIQASDEESKRIARLTVPILQQYGKVMTEHICLEDVLAWEAENTKAGINICDRDLAWLNETDFMVADISRASTGVGLEVMYNLGVLNHPVLAVHKEGTGTRMITQLEHPLLSVRQYRDDAELGAIVSEYCRNFQQPFRLYERFVMFDAIDGAGKGALYESMKEWAKEKGMRHFDMLEFWQHHERIPSWEEVQEMSGGCDLLLFAEPTYQGVGKVVRNTIIRKDAAHPFSARSTADGYGLDRDVLFKVLLHDALESGIFVAADRGVITSFVYQPVQASMFEGYSQPYFMGYVRGLAGNQYELEHTPGLGVIPQVDPVIADALRQQRKEKDDNARFENLDFQSAIAKVYLDPALRRFFERRGTKVVDLIREKGDTRDDTKRKMRAIWENYLAG